MKTTFEEKGAVRSGLVEVTSAEAWARCLAGQPRVPLQQSWAYGAALERLGLKTVRLAGEGAALQVIERRLFGPVRLVSVIRGPLFDSAVPAGAQARALRALKERYRRRSGALLMVTPDNGGVSEAKALFRAMGARRVMTGSGTIWLDLSVGQDALWSGLRGAWRTSLRKAEGLGLNLKMDTARPADLDWILNLEAAQARARGYHGLPARVIRAFAEATPKDVLFATARNDGERIAAALFLCHGPSATYQIGWTGADGRNLGAQPALLWHALGDLGQRGVRTLDLGGIDTVNAPGVARFKLGLGGEVVLGPGTFF